MELKRLKKPGKRFLRERERLVNQFENLLHQKAWASWRRLPPSVRIWVDPDDLFQETYVEALRCYPKWDPAKATFSTFIYTCVDNFLRDYASIWRRKKRLPAIQVPLVDVDRELQAEFQLILEDAVLMRLYEDESVADPIVELAYATGGSR